VKSLFRALGSSAIGAILAWPAVARADICPVTHDATHSDLHLYNYSPTPGVRPRFLVGNFNFYGSSVIGACVQDASIGFGGTLYVMVDQDNHLLGWLPATYNSFCLTSGIDDMRVLTGTESLCGTTMTPLNYNGSVLTVYGLDGSDHIDGGNGFEMIHGGSGPDNLADGSQRVGDNPIYACDVWGEADNDLLFGSVGNNSILSGGPGNDAIADRGGTGDVLVGGDGNECCMADSNEPGAIWCEGGTDTVHSLAGTHNCEVASSTCDVTLNACMP